MLPLIAVTLLSTALAQEAAPAAASPPAAAQAPAPLPVAPAPAATPAPAPTAILEVTSTGSAVTVARIFEHTTGLGYAFGTGNGGAFGSGPTIINSATYSDLCMTPCRVEVPAGFTELRFHGRGTLLPLHKKYTLQAGETIALRVDPASLGRALMGAATWITGGTTVVLFGYYLVNDATVRPRDRYLSPSTDTVFLGCGLALAGLGFWGLRTSRAVVTEVTPTSASVTYNGEF